MSASLQPQQIPCSLSNSLLEKNLKIFIDGYLLMQDTVREMNDALEETGEWFGNWTVQMRKGLLDFCILRALKDGEWYGYALVKALVAIPGIGVAEGSIYPLLSRLKKQGLVNTRLEESNEGPARKYYSLTATGRRFAEEMAVYFETMIRGVETLGKQKQQQQKSL